jgi:type IV pilus assembly protein PilA
MTTKKSRRITQNKKTCGFSLTEAITTVAIIGTVASVATPQYIRHKQKNCQKPAESTMAMVLTQVQAYNDEYGQPATGWSDLDKISTLMTATGPAKGDNFNPIQLTSCEYDLRGSQSGSRYLFSSSKRNSGHKDPSDSNNQTINTDASIPGRNTFNVVACIDTSTGASDVRSGDDNNSASTEDLTCG